MKKLKAAGITPISLGAGDKWPAMFWYGYLALRIAGAEVMQQAGIDENFDDPAFIRAGEEIQRLVALEPFQSGFLATPWDGPDGAAGVISNGKAAMLLMGHWAPGTMEANGPGLGDDLGWFPFPAVEGGDGRSEGRVRRRQRLRRREGRAARGGRVPRVPLEPRGREAGRQRGEPPPDDVGSEDSITDPNLVDVIDARGEADYVQLYLDQAYPPEVGAAVNDSTATLFAGRGTPQTWSRRSTPPGSSPRTWAEPERRPARPARRCETARERDAAVGAARARPRRRWPLIAGVPDAGARALRSSSSSPRSSRARGTASTTGTASES